MCKNDNSETEHDPKAAARVLVPAHAKRTIPWQQQFRSGSQADRMLREITVSLPPRIADLEPEVPSDITAEAEQTLTVIAHLDAIYGDHLSALSTLLLRAESVASSKIEQIDASIEDFARAAHGSKSNPSATSMVASAAALHNLITSVENHRPITLENILAAHQILMSDDPYETEYAGRIRDLQNWIGGSDHSPRGALYIPPPPETVASYLDDLLVFANRDDLPVLTQAAIAHAQFESIHPFTDGNGRIGRALINTILRRRGITSRVVIPLASALVARRDTYFDLLNTYRQGDASPIIRAFNQASHTAARESQLSAQHLRDMPQQWIADYKQSTGREPRANSATQEILTELPGTPFFTAEEMADTTSASSSSVYTAIQNLVNVGILHRLTERKRNQVWCAIAIVNELEDLGMRIAVETNQNTFWQELSTQLASILQNQP